MDITFSSITNMNAVFSLWRCGPIGNTQIGIAIMVLVAGCGPKAMLQMEMGGAAAKCWRYRL